MNSVIRNRNTIFLLTFLGGASLNATLLSSANSAYTNILLPLQHVFGSIGMLFTELLVCLIGLILINRLAKYTFSNIDQIVLEARITWLRALLLLGYCTALFWSFYLVIWSISYIISTLVLDL